jgi:hypothetical protein
MISSWKRCAALVPAAFLLLAPAVASAGADPQKAGGTQSGTLTVEPIRDSFVITPDIRVTDFDGATRTLVGGYGGLLKENTLMLGAGGYWLADHSRNRELAYGGFVAQWTIPLGRAVRFGLRGLAGGGQATIVRSVTYGVPYFDDRMHGPASHTTPGALNTVSGDWRFKTTFIVAEPQADVVLRVTPWLAVNAGVGYRAIGWADGLEKELRGLSGSFGIRIGKS